MHAFYTEGLRPIACTAPLILITPSLSAKWHFTTVDGSQLSFSVHTTNFFVIDNPVDNVYYSSQHYHQKKPAKNNSKWVCILSARST